MEKHIIDSAKSIDFKPYLESIRSDKDYLELKEIYISSTVERSKQTPQNKCSRRLKLQVETVTPQKNQTGDNRETLADKPWDVLEGLRNCASEHVLLIGKPGSGKSTSLERLLWEEAENALNDSAVKLPVLVKLRRVTSTIENLIQDFFSQHQLSLEIADVEHLLQQGKLLLLLDGLNELPDTFRTEVVNFRDRYRKTVPMVVSTRNLSIGGNLGIRAPLFI